MELYKGSSVSDNIQKQVPGLHLQSFFYAVPQPQLKHNRHVYHQDNLGFDRIMQT